MKDVEVANTRNFALIGHSKDGKTSLGEALIHSGGASASLGRVDDGNSLLDFQPEEKERKATLGNSIFAFEVAGHHLTLVDTPGDPNFIGDAEIALRALDGAVLLVSAVSGAKVGTEKVWRIAGEAGVATLAFVNGVDRERADFAAAVESLRKIGANAVPMAIPIGEHGSLSGVVDLRSMKASTEAGETAIPDALLEEAAAARQRMIESVAECDDELLEKYLEEGELGDEEIRRGLLGAIRERRLVPVFCGAATRLIGVAPLLAGIRELLPAPCDRAPWTAAARDGGAGAQVEADPAAPFTGLVFKTLIDPYAGTLSLLRVVSGTLHGDSQILNATRDQRERLGKLLLPQGAKHADASEAGPGDVVAVAKLKHVHTGDALCAEKGGVELPALPIPQGVISYAIRAKTKGQEDKVFTSLARLVEEDPTLHIGREASTGEFLLTGMGELHVRITVEKLRRMFGAEVELKMPMVPYRETITRKAENVEGKLKKQTGGKGMFGVCYLTVEPRGRGEGFEFSDEIVGGAIPRNLIPAVEKGVVDAMSRGPIAGYPVVDVRVRCIDGKHHSVDSNEMAFKLAGSFGFKAAVERAKPTLLEPMMNVEVHCPRECVGDIMGDISSRRGRVQSSEAQGGSQVIKAQVPMSEMLEYANSLTSMTSGQGDFQLEFSHYEEVPAGLRDRVIGEARVRQAEAT